MSEIDQVYVTHCAQGDSLRNESEFSLRAASTDDADLRQFALNYPGFELPLGSAVTNPPPEEAPRRLARVPTTSGHTALLQTVYAGLDTSKRPGNYFTHFVFDPDLTLRQALETWGSPGWANNYRPGANKKLPQFPTDKLAPSPTNPLNRDCLTRFLADPDFPAEPKLGLSLCPPRLAGQAERRQQLLAMMLTGVLEVLKHGAGRRRLYVLAEPGLAAMLLYGAAWLLPGRLVQGLTFSTYEPLHRSFRTFEDAQVICTYVKDGGHGLDGDYASGRGVALDAFEPERGSRELAAPHQLLTTLVACAARGEWGRVEALHAYHSSEQISVDSLREALGLASLFEQLKGRLATEDELLKLAGTPQGRAAVERNKAALFESAYEAGLVKEQVRVAYKGLLLGRAPELRKRCAEALAEASRAAPGAVAAAWGRWHQRWALLASLRDRDVPAQCGDFLEVVNKSAAGQSGGPCAVRPRLLAQWHGLSPGAELPPAVQDLLAPATPAELDELRRADLPPAWQVLAILTGLERPATRAAAVAWLRGDARMMETFCREVVRQRPRDRLPDLLLHVARDGEALDPRCCEYLLAHGAVMPADARLVVLDALFKAASDKLEFASQGTILVGCLHWVKDAPKAAASVWKNFTEKLHERALCGDPTQEAVLSQLRQASAGRESVPPAVLETIDHWGLLHDLLHQPGAAGRVTRPQVTAAMRHLGINRDPFLQHYFLAAVAGRPTSDAAFERFAAAFDRFHHCGRDATDYQSQYTLLHHWLQAVKGAKDADLRGQYQRHFLAGCPESLRPELFREAAKHPLLRPAVADWLANELQQMGGDDEAPAEAPAAAAPAREKPAPKARRGFSWWTVIVVAVVVAAGSFIAGLIMAGGKGEPPASGDGAQQSKNEGKDKQPPQQPPGKPVKVTGLDREGVQHLSALFEHLTADTFLRRDVIERVGGKELRNSLDRQLDGLNKLLEKAASTEGEPESRKQLASISQALDNLGKQMQGKWKVASMATAEGEQVRLRIWLWHYCLDLSDAARWQGWQEKYLLNEIIKRAKDAEQRVELVEDDGDKPKKKTPAEIGQAQQLKKDLGRVARLFERWRDTLENAEKDGRTRPKLAEDLKPHREKITDRLIERVAEDRFIHRQQVVGQPPPTEIYGRLQRLEQELTAPMGEVSKLLK